LQKPQNPHSAIQLCIVLTVDGMQRNWFARVSVFLLLMAAIVFHT